MEVSTRRGAGAGAMREGRDPAALVVVSSSRVRCAVQVGGSSNGLGIRDVSACSVVTVNQVTGLQIKVLLI